MQFELSREYRERLQQAIDARDSMFITESLSEANAADISALLDEFDTDDCKYVLELLGSELRADVISELEEDTREKFLRSYSTDELADIVDNLDSDDAADILNELPLKEREEVIAEMGDAEKEANVLELLRYEEDVAGGLMAKELIKANINWTIDRCIEEIRQQAENVDKIFSIYVVDDQEKLVGKVSLKRIILSSNKLRVSDIYDNEVIAVETYQSEEEVANIMRKYDLESVPVVNIQGKLLGRITIDDVVDVISELAEEERQIMSGISEDVEEDDSVIMLTRARLPWLVIGVVGGFISAKFMGVFEEELARVTAIAFFIPLIQATGGNVGIQSSSIVLQSLANPSAFSDNMWKRLFKVFIVAAVNGLVLGVMVYAFNRLTGGMAGLSFIVSLALFFVVIVASFMGTITPLILNRFGFNPALASGPFITTTNDLIGIGIYFYTVSLLL